MNLGERAFSPVADVQPTVSHLNLLENLYAGLANHQGFEAFLQSLQMYFRSCSAVLITVASDPRQYMWGWAAGMPDHFLGWCRENAVALQHVCTDLLEFVGSRADGFVSARLLLDDGELQDHVADCLKPWLRRQAVVDVAGLVIPLPAKGRLVLLLQRDQETGKFEQADIGQLNLLASNIRQALQIFAAAGQYRPCCPPVEDIRELLKISYTEAQICYLLVEGLTLKDIARKRNVSIHTVREQMRRIYQKTGYRRQADVIAAILRRDTPFADGIRLR